MKHTWYEDIVSTVEKCISIKIPFEIVHFPSTGVTSAINKLSQTYKESEANIILIPIDFEAVSFSKDLNESQSELFRVVKTQIEQQIGITIDHTSEENFFKKLEEILKNYVQLKKKVFFVLETTSKLEIERIPGFHDFLVFLDILRDFTEGAINIIITSTYPLFKENNPCPIPIITQYYNYQKPARVFRTFNEDIFQKKVKPEKLLEIIEATNGLAALGKGIYNDLQLLDKKANDVDFTKIDSNFFKEFQATKQYMDRIKSKFNPKILDSFKAVVLEKNLESIDPETVEYLQKTGFLDESNKIKGTIFKEYCKMSLLNNKNCEPIAPKPLPNIIAPSFDDDDFYKLTKDLFIHKVSGEIYFRNKITDKYLTEKELLIIKELFINRNSPVSKEKIAQIIWSKDYTEKYSEWAIDKLISRLREKLEDKKPNHIILTARNKGYMLA